MSQDARPSPASDEELARRSQEGCRASFEELVRRFQVPLVRFLQHRTATPADAEDVTQETFVRAYEHLDRYRSTWRFSTWLFTIARRVALNHRRHRAATCDNGALESAPADTPEPIDLAADQEGSHSLWALAARVLTEEQFTATWLYYVDGLPTNEIALALGRSRVAVKTVLFRARRRLLAYLDASSNPSGPTRKGSARSHKTNGRQTAETTHG